MQKTSRIRNGNPSVCGGVLSGSGFSGIGVVQKVSAAEGDAQIEQGIYVQLGACIDNTNFTSRTMEIKEDGEYTLSASGMPSTSPAIMNPDGTISVQRMRQYIRLVTDLYDPSYGNNFEIKVTSVKIGKKEYTVDEKGEWYGAPITNLSYPLLADEELRITPVTPNNSYMYTTPGGSTQTSVAIAASTGSAVAPADTFISAVTTASATGYSLTNTTYVNGNGTYELLLGTLNNNDAELSDLMLDTDLYDRCMGENFRMKVTKLTIGDREYAFNAIGEWFETAPSNQSYNKHTNTFTCDTPYGPYTYQKK